MHLLWRGALASCVVVCFAPSMSFIAEAQTALPQVNVTVASPIAKPKPARRAPAQTAAQPGPAPTPSATPAEPLQGTLPIVTGQFATVTVVPNEEIRRNGASTLGGLLFSKPGITGSSFAPGASSRPIIRGLDTNRVGIVENGISGGGASDLGEDHFVPIDPLSTNQVEVIRGPAALRYGSQSIGGVVSGTNNRIPDALPTRAAVTEFRGSAESVNNGLDGAVLLDAGHGHWAIHADAFARKADDYLIPNYPYLVPPDPATAPNASQPGNFNGHQPNSALQANGESAGVSYFFPGGFTGLAVTQNNALYHIPGIDGEDHNTRIDAHQTKITGKGEYRTAASAVDTVRYWWGATDYKHDELGLADDTDLGSDGVRQIFTNREQEGRIEATLSPFNLRFAQLTTAVGAQIGHQRLTAPSPDNAGLWDPNSNTRYAGYVFNEFGFSSTTKAQIAGRIEHVDLSGFARSFPSTGGTVSTPAARGFTPTSASLGVIQDLPWNLEASITGQYIERAPKPAELFSGGGHDATVTFDKGNVNLHIETAQSIELALRRAAGRFRFEATAYYTRFNGFIFRNLTGNTCDPDTDVCGPDAGELNEAIYSQQNAIFRGGEFQSQFDVTPLGPGVFGFEDQFDVVRATFTNGTNVPRIPPARIGGGLYWRNSSWLARVDLLHAFAHNQIAATETPTAGYNDLRIELSYQTKLRPTNLGPRELTIGLTGTNLLNDDIRNSVSYTKDEVLLPGTSVRFFANVRF